MVRKKKVSPPSVSVWFCLDLLKANKSDGSEVRVGGTSAVLRRWTPPPQGWLKLNVDAILNLMDNKVGLGMVIRDDLIKGKLKIVRLLLWMADF